MTNVFAALKLCDKCERSYIPAYRTCIYCSGQLRPIEASAFEPGMPPVIGENVWTCEAAIDALFKDIIRSEQELKKDGQLISSKKYMHQAALIQDRIGLYRPCYFDVWREDLQPETLYMLGALNKKGLDYVLRTSLLRVYELIAPDTAATLDLKRVTCRIVSN
jgi:hypothetical protein